MDEKVNYDKDTEEWLSKHPGEFVWFTQCPTCGKVHMTKLIHRCEGKGKENEAKRKTP